MHLTPEETELIELLSSCEVSLRYFVKEVRIVQSPAIESMLDRVAELKRTVSMYHLFNGDEE